MIRKNMIWIHPVVLTAIIFLVNLSLSGYAQSGEKSLQQDQLIELKRIGVMIGQGKPDTDVQESWKMMINKNKDININSAINSILSEAQLETERNVNAAKKKVQFYSSLQEYVSLEIKNARNILSKTAENKEPVRLQKKVFEISPNPEGEVIVGQTEIISTKTELENYIKELEEHLNTVGDDSQLANVDLQSILQKQQQTLQMLSTISKTLHDTAMSIIRKIGG